MDEFEPTPVEMPLYQCHKQVRAMKIDGIRIYPDGSAFLESAQCPVETRLAFTTGPRWADRYKGSGRDLGYYVRYEDGYESWSPSEAFEAGYTRI
jgi:hypothetical protein